MDKNDLIPVKRSVYYQLDDSPPTHCYGTWSRVAKFPTHYLVEKRLWEDRDNDGELKDALGRDVDRLLVENARATSQVVDLEDELARIRYRRMKEIDEMWAVLREWKMEMDYGSHPSSEVHAVVYCVLTRVLKETFQVEMCPICLGTTYIVANQRRKPCNECRHHGYPHGWVYIISEEEDDEEG